MELKNFMYFCILISEITFGVAFFFVRRHYLQLLKKAIKRAQNSEQLNQ
jgi:hypothetical protein